MSKDSVNVPASSDEESKAVKKTKKAAKPAPKKQNKVFKYFRELRSEFKKVVWPTKKQVVNNTGVVLTAMIISGLVLFGIDSGFSELFKLILKR